MNAQNQAAQAKLGGQIEVLTQENSDHKSLLAAEMNELRNDVAKLKTLKAGVSNQNADIASIKENV